MSVSSYYEDEKRIVWLKDRESLAKLGYVRERQQTTQIRSGPVQPSDGEILIGYAVLKNSTAKTSQEGFRRRIFILKPADRYFDPEGVFKDSMPRGAVDPLQVQAGKPSQRL